MCNYFVPDALVIISDEVHCDLLRKGKVFTPLEKLFPESDHIVNEDHSGIRTTLPEEIFPLCKSLNAGPPSVIDRFSTQLKSPK